MAKEKKKEPEKSTSNTAEAIREKPEFAFGPEKPFKNAPDGTKVVSATLDELKKYEADGLLVGWDGTFALIKQ